MVLDRPLEQQVDRGVAGEQVGLELRPAEQRGRRSSPGGRPRRGRDPRCSASSGMGEPVARPHVARVVRGRADPGATSLIATVSASRSSSGDLGLDQLLGRAPSAEPSRLGRPRGSRSSAPTAAATRSRTCWRRSPPDRGPRRARTPGRACPDRWRISPRSTASPSGGRAAELLGELPARRGERILVGVVLALGDRPRAVVAAGPERSAGVDEQHLELATTVPVQQDPGAARRDFARAR